MTTPPTTKQARGHYLHRIFEILDLCSYSRRGLSVGQIYDQLTSEVTRRLLYSDIKMLRREGFLLPVEGSRHPRRYRLNPAYARPVMMICPDEEVS